MRRISYNSLAVVALAVGLLTSAVAFAQGDGRTCPGNTPTPNGALVTTRVFNDCPTSIVSVNNAYPALIRIDDTDNDCFGGANRHVWHLSADGGQTAALFENCSHYRFGAHVVLSHTGPAVNFEAGLLLSPWWSIADGQFMINGGGEIAAFGARLPFYSFTVNHGISYVPGTNIYLEYTYNPRGLSAALPATILYHVYYNGQNYYSPYLPFDQGTPAEDPPHGLWGELYPASPGGYVQGNNGQGNPAGVQAVWDGFQFEGPSATPAQQATWGRIKTLYR